MAAPAAVHERGGVARTAAHAAAHCSGSASHAARPRASLRCRLPRSARPRVRRRRRRARTRAQHPAARHPARAAAPRNSPARACTHTRSRRSGALAPRLLSGARTSHKKMLYSHDLCFASKHARKRCFQPNQLRTRFLAVLALGESPWHPRRWRARARGQAVGGQWRHPLPRLRCAKPSLIS
jgi:hypothetical protein